MSCRVLVRVHCYLIDLLNVVAQWDVKLHVNHIA